MFNPLTFDRQRPPSATCAGVLIAVVLLLFGEYVSAADAIVSAPISAGSLNSAFLKSDGSAWAWGYNSRGENGDWILPNQLNGAEPTAISIPVPMTYSSPLNVRALATGGWDGDIFVSHTLMLLKDGTVFGSGDNRFGQLGLGSTDGQHGLEQPIASISNVMAVAAGGYHSLALKSDGSVWAWGRNEFGQGGDGTTTSQLLNPVNTIGLSDVISISAGALHSLALTEDGRVWAWGYNSYGQLGFGNRLNTNKATVIGGLANIIAISAGGNDSLALKADGTVWAWGNNEYGQCGIGVTALSQPTPVQVTNLVNIIAISAGGFHNLALDISGTIWAWGRNDYGQIGDSASGASQLIPVKVINIGNARGIAAGQYHSLAVLDDGSVFGWGDGNKLQIGSHTSARINPKPLPIDTSITAAYGNYSLQYSYSCYCYLDAPYGPQSIPVADASPVQSAKVASTLLAKADGTVWTCGQNSLSGLSGDVSPVQSTLEQINGLSEVVQVSAGGSHDLALTRVGTVFAWGANTSGQLGDGVMVGSSDPVQTITAQSSSTNMPSGLISLWRGEGNGLDEISGHNGFVEGNVSFASGIVGDGFNFDANPPGRVSVADDPDFDLTNSITLEAWILSKKSNGIIVQRGCYGNHTLSWRLEMEASNNVDFLISDPKGHTVDVTTPIQMDQWQHVAATLDNSSSNMDLYINGVLAVQTNTPLRPMGPLPVIGGVPGGIGIGNIQHDPLENYISTLPFSGMIDEVAIYSRALSASEIEATYVSRLTNHYLSGIKSVAAGGWHSLALGTNGTVWTWGDNSFYQLGVGNVPNQTIATNLSSLSGIQSIAAGQVHSLALDSSGEVWGWGCNTYGQLGSSTYTNQPAPLLIGGLPAIAAISAGDRHSLALGTNGSVYAWGDNRSGQLGISGVLQKAIPTIVSGLPAIRAIGAGVQFSVALATNGTVWTWGWNGSGQLGNQSTVSNCVPAQVAGLSGVANIQVFSDHVVAIMPDSSIRVWGGNNWGELGVGNQTNQLAPVAVSGFYLTQPSFAPTVLSSFATNATRYVRSSATDPTYTSFVIPLEFEQGVKLDDMGTNGEYFSAGQPWFTQIASRTNYHVQLISAVTNLDNSQTDDYSWTLGFQNPIVSFGSSAGGTPLNMNQPYAFGVYSGAQYESTNADGSAFITPIRILVYRKSDFGGGSANTVSPIATNLISVPRRTVVGDQTAWNEFITNGLTVTLETNGLRTVLQLVEEQSLNPITNVALRLSANGISVTNPAAPSTWNQTAQTNQIGVNTTNVLETSISMDTGPSVGAWGVSHSYTNALNGPFVLTQTAFSPDYCYVIEAMGVVPSGITNASPVVVDGTLTNASWDRLYSLDFDNPEPWRAVFVSEPQFNGQPMPPSYLVTTNPIALNPSVVTNLTNGSCLALDGSPELRRHPILDQFVQSMNYDPIALANYVQNNIELCDPLSYNENSGQASAPTITQDGVSRSALDVYQEGEGSPMEQCALLIYMLRSAGYPAEYVFPTNNNIQMSDSHVSSLLQMQIHGAVNESGALYTTNTMITVNYPWVVAQIGTNYIQLFPWLKDTKMIEGLNLYDYLPDGYNSGALWLQHYLYADPSILSLDSESDAPSVLFPKFITGSLAQNYPGISIADIGMQIQNRQHYYSRWQDFPTPDSVNNPSQSVLVDSLSSSVITNVSPLMTNVFNTMEVMLYSTTQTNLYIDTGEMRMADLHNRRFLVLTNSGNMELWLAPLVAGITSQSNFTNDLALTNCEIATLAITDGPTFGLTTTYRRHKAINPSAVPATNYLGVFEQLVTTETTPFGYSPGSNKRTTSTRLLHTNEVTALCFNPGRVTEKMVDVHAIQYWQMQQETKTNKAYAPAMQDYQGTAVYLMGMDYFRSVDRFKSTDERLHKAHILSWNSEAVCELIFETNKSKTLTRPILDVYNSEIAYAGNGTVHPNSGNNLPDGTDDFMMILLGEMGAQEHDILDQYYTSTNAVSAVEFLRIAQQDASATTNGIIELTVNNYQTLGNSPSMGYGTNLLKNYDTNLWAVVTNAFSGWDAAYTHVFITPARIEDSAKFFNKMAAVVIGKGRAAYIATGDGDQGLLNQGEIFDTSLSGCGFLDFGCSGQVDLYSSSFDSSFGGFDDTSYGSYGSIDTSFMDSSTPSGLLYDGSYIDDSFAQQAASSSVTAPSIDQFTDPSTFGVTQFSFSAGSSVDAGTASSYEPEVINSMDPTLLGLADLSLTPDQTDGSSYFNNQSFSSTFTGETPQQSLVSQVDIGNVGDIAWFQQNSSSVFDPVNPITGAFHIDTTDLELPGPFPLRIRRNYSSQNLSSENYLGYGWRFNYLPYLVYGTNKTKINTNLILCAAEEDGSVIVYRQESAPNTNIFVPIPQDNPTLDNNSSQGVGSTVNPFNAQIIRSQSGTSTNFTLKKADGSVRVFQVMSFPLISTNVTISRTRPYLLSCVDNRGNSLSFSYQTNSSAPGYGEVNRIQCSNGNFINLYYNTAAFITQIEAGDGRVVQYEYDNYGDLVAVTLPDGSETSYEYNHYILGAGGVGSDHTLLREIKPDGHVLQNTYDSQRRVLNQMTTVGPDALLHTNAVFEYYNNWAYTTSATNLVSGYTWTEDANLNTTVYGYTNDLITSITDPLGQTTTQSWYFTNDSSGGYQCSLKSIVDKRGLTSTFIYDTNGNVLTNILSGADLTGDGQTNITLAFTYTTNNTYATQVDAIGNTTVYSYDNTNYPFMATATRSYASNGIAVATNTFVYTNTFTVVTIGPLILTNWAFGMLARAVKAVNSPDASTNDDFFDGRGLLTEEVKYSGTTDPNITNFYYYDSRGELVQKTDAIGRSAVCEYDALGRITGKQMYDVQSSSPASTEYSYYDGNGDLIWYDGPRSNPEDYVWYDYDGAGRKIEEIHWRSKAKADGSGVQAETGDNLYATTFYTYDLVGNKTSVEDQHGNVTRMVYDALGRVVDQRSYAPNSVTPLSEEQFGYEPGNQVSADTNALGGVTLKYYTTAGQLKQQINPDGSVLQYTFYPDGRPRRQYLANGNYYELTYDDANRIAKRTFSGDPSFLETKAFDRRGNLIAITNSVGAVFTSSYDGLGRVKQKTGPASQGGTTQEIHYWVYDNCGRQVVVSNALGESVLSTYDVLGRITTNAIYDASSNEVNLTVNVYSADNNSVTTIKGSTTSVLTTVFTDTFGKPILTQKFPSFGITNSTINVYDILEHLVTSVDELGQSNSFAYDPIGRLAAQTNADGSAVTFAYDAAGNMTQRKMPGGLVWSGTYDTANRKLGEGLQGAGTADRTFTNVYYGTNSPYVGLLQSGTDLGRNVTNVLVYDSYLRLATSGLSGKLPDQNLTLSYQYDQRGLLTNLTQTGLTASNSVQCTFDMYGNVAEEKVLINGVAQSDFTEQWDAAGRRDLLAQVGGGTGSMISYGYRADGMMTNVFQANQSFSFNYLDNGILTLRTNAWRSVAVNVLDSEGRPLRETTTVTGGGTMLSERYTWRPNSTLNLYRAGRAGIGAWPDIRLYQYDSRNQLISEPVGISSTTAATNSYSFDPSQLGVLTNAQWSGGISNQWHGSLDGLDRVSSENWNIYGLTLRASGQAQNASSVSVNLDNVLQSSTTTNGGWYADLINVTNGSHSLTASGVYTVGQFTNTVTNAFTVVGANAINDYYDGAGNLTNRSFNGKTNLYVWDGLGRLVRVIERDNPTNGFNWSAVYDGFGRRLRTVQTPVVNGITNTIMNLTLDSYYDPQVEFEELAVGINGQRTWKVMGPDLNGRYGGLQGTGGLEATVSEYGGVTNAVLNDYFGNVLATIVGTNASWSSIRVGGYGPVAGYESPVLSASMPLAQTLLWRSHRIDPTGLYYLGARYYDPMAGHFISPDPLGHSSSMDLYSAFNGDPINNFDPKGMCSQSSSGSFDSSSSYSSFGQDNSYESPIQQQLANLEYNESPEGQFMQAYEDTQANDYYMRNSGYLEAPEGLNTGGFDVGKAVSTALNMTPGIGMMKIWWEGLSDQDMITGQQLNRSGLETGLLFTGSALGTVGFMGGMMSEAALSGSFEEGYANWQAENVLNWQTAPGNTYYGAIEESYGTSAANLMRSVDETRDIVRASLSGSQRGPVISGVMNLNSGEIFYGLNGEEMSEVHPALINQGVTLDDLQHSEVVALNKALWAADAPADADFSDFMIYNRRFSNNPLLPPNIPRCSSCQDITAGAASMSDPY